MDVGARQAKVFTDTNRVCRCAHDVIAGDHILGREHCDEPVHQRLQTQLERRQRLVRDLRPP